MKEGAVMKFCPKCGKELNDDTKICDSCGFDFDSLHTENKKQKIPVKSGNGWIVASVCSFVVSIIMIYKGYDKYVNYYNSDYTSLNVNSYVGGDAYNYIINSNYVTGFYVLATLFTILGVGFLIIHYLSKKDNR